MHDVHDSWHFINASSTWFRNWEGEGRERGGGVSGGYFLSFFSSSLNPWFDLRSHTLYELGNKRNVPQHTSPPPFFPSGPPGVSRNKTSIFQHSPAGTEQRKNRKKNSENPFFS